MSALLLSQWVSLGPVLIQQDYFQGDWVHAIFEPAFEMFARAKSPEAPKRVWESLGDVRKV
ncbi:hypothetical protein PAXRUDRAFT_21040 [Paxillus rubicundulus Ve08.2h10]|uniref:Uncharacterized protein n=1 Tax=Paxillus rubicundulus Ve08.2h10 TaxID=930991 RepID=A0A0D0CCP8_9AGAM|nr:hypothetical protein PAXRUDRAFT_21040 [Paxillus rubicundulus Ve08.2h10]